MKILVVGGTGHTGERLVRRLIADGHAVTVLSRRGAGEPNLDGLLRAGAAHAPGDSHRRAEFHAALAGKDVLFSCAHAKHAAACVRACEAAGVRRYLQMSSTRRFTRFPCESAQAVIDGEAAITASNLDYTILRATMIFGGRRDANLTRLVAWFRRHRWFPLFGSGENLVQPIFVEDLLDAMMAAFHNPAASARRAFTLAGPEPLPYRRFLQETAAACGRPNPTFIPVPLRLALVAAKLAPPFLAKRGLTAEQVQRLAEDKDADISEARAALGFSPRPYAEAIRLKAEGRAEVV